MHIYIYIYIYIYICICIYVYFKIVPDSAIGHSDKVVTKKELPVVDSVLIHIQCLLFFQVLVHSCVNPLLLVFLSEKVSTQR